MAQILKRPRALIDLVELWSYIAEDSVANADKFLLRIDKILRLLARHSLVGRARPELYKGLRSFPSGRYLIFYLPLPRGVEVVRVLHASRDIETIFQSQEPREISLSDNIGHESPSSARLISSFK